MTRYIPFIASLFLAGGAVGQGGQYLNATSRWMEVTECNNLGYYSIQRYNLFMNDTVTLSGQLYYILWMSGYDSTFLYPSMTFSNTYPISSSAGYIREDSVGRIIYRSTGSMPEDTVFTPGYNVGDTVQCQYSYPVINSIDSIYLGGFIPRKRHFSDSFYCAEGIGYAQGLRTPDPCNVGIECWTTMICYQQSTNNVRIDTASVEPCNMRLGTVGITEPWQKQVIQFYPNPITNLATFDIQSSKLNIQKLELYSINGLLLREEKTTDTHNITLHRDNLPSGMYLVVVIGEHGVLGRQKVVVQ